MTNTTDDEWQDHLGVTDFSCSYSDVSLAYGDGVIAISIMVAAQDSQGRFSPQHALTEDRDDLLYEPHFLEVPSWEEIDEDMHGLLEDSTPINDTYSIAFCKYCSSGIRAGEVFLMATFGEIHISRRMPSGQVRRTDTFEAMDNSPTIMCLGCQNIMHDRKMEFWEERVKQHEECETGTMGRCWRYGCAGDKATCDLSRGRNPWQEPH